MTPVEVPVEERKQIVNVLQRNAKFLARLYSACRANNKYAKKKIFERASLEQLNDLIRILSYVIRGKIPLCSYQYRYKLRKTSPQFKKLLELKNPVHMNLLLNKSLEEKAEHLRAKIGQFKYLLHRIFHKCTCPNIKGPVAA